MVTKGDQYDVREAGSGSENGRGDVRNLGKPVELAGRYIFEVEYGGWVHGYPSSMWGYIGMYYLLVAKMGRLYFRTIMSLFIIHCILGSLVLSGVDPSFK